MILQFNKNQTLSKLTDEQLIAQYQATGKSEYVGELYNRYVHLVYGICLKYTKHKEESKDISMNVFEKILSNLPSTEIQSFKKWLYITTKNQCLTHLRDRNNKVDQSVDWQELEKKSKFFVENEDFLSLNNEHSEEEKIHVALMELKPDQRKCMDLFFYKDMSYKEIEKKTGYTIKQVKSFLQNGKRKLKMILESKGIDSEK